jgi:hypothetical protein
MLNATNAGERAGIGVLKDDLRSLPEPAQRAPAKVPHVRTGELDRAGARVNQPEQQLSER